MQVDWNTNPDRSSEWSPPVQIYDCTRGIKLKDLCFLSIFMYVLLQTHHYYIMYNIKSLSLTHSLTHTHTMMTNGIHYMVWCLDLASLSTKENNTTVNVWRLPESLHWYSCTLWSSTCLSHDTEFGVHSESATMMVPCWPTASSSWKQTQNF